MKILHDFADNLKKALAAIDGAEAAGERAKAAQQKYNALLADSDNLDRANKRAKADADAYVERQTKAAQALEASMQAQLGTHKAKLKETAARSQAAIDAASVTLETINADVGKLRAERDALTADIARIKANLADTVGRL